MRQFADKTHRIAQQKGHILIHQFAGGGIQRGKEFILGKYIAFAQQVHDGRTCPHLYILPMPHAPVLTSFLSLGLRLAYQFPLAFLLQQHVILSLHNTTVGFNFGFTGAPCSNSTSQPFQMLPHATSIWATNIDIVQVLPAGVLVPFWPFWRKYPKSDPTAVDRFAIKHFFNIRNL